MMNDQPLRSKIEQLLQSKGSVFINPAREKIIRKSIEKKEALVSERGALATWTSRESTGRSPKDTLTVQRPENRGSIDWDSPNNRPLDVETFDMVFNDALSFISASEEVYITDRVIGAEEGYALPVRTITDHALTSLFTLNMFRDRPENMLKSIFSNRPFLLISFPHTKLNKKRYQGRLRMLKDGTTSNMVIAMDFERSVGIIIGSAYLGSVKKLMFTAMNYYLPQYGILPLHCSANEDSQGNCALLLGLSGTGKTALSTHANRALLGDDEHGWSDKGIANFENGCYAKMINIDPEKEPEIYQAVMHEDTFTNHGTIVENAMIYPNGQFAFDDNRLTPNSRASYPLEYLKNIKKSSLSGHPETILFLTADAYGVLPPISRLSPDQAMLWFLMGYTSKVPGTETGIKGPQATFSRFFGQPFMPANPNIYANMLGEKLAQFQTRVYLINTGWTGGPYGSGKRIDIIHTRIMTEATLSGELKKEMFHHDALFHLNIPEHCPGIPNEILIPRNTWQNKKAYDQQAKKLARMFSEAFDQHYGNKKIRKRIWKQCPGK